MTPTLEFAPYAAMARRIAQRLAASRDAASPLAQWSEETIVASSGVASAVSQRLLELIPGGIAGLRLQTVETFATRLLGDAGEYPRVASDGERRLAMRAAARTVAEPLMETRGAAAMLERTYRDVRDSGLTLEDFTSRMNAASTIRNRSRLRSMLRAWQEYERLIGRLNAIDPADLLLRAAALIRGGARVSPQLLAGFYDMTGVHMALIATLRSVEKLAAVYVPIHPDRPAPFAQGMISAFDSVLAPQEPALAIKGTSWTISECRTREDEIERTCAAVAASSGKSIGIVTRSLDPYDLHLFERYARKYGIALTTAAPQPLTSQRIGRGVVLLLRMRERGFMRSDVLEVVRCGLRVNTRINVDKADAETRRAHIAAGTSAELQGRAANNLVVGDYVALVAELESLTEKIDARFLKRIPDLFRAETESDLAALDAIDAIADLFTRATVWNKPFEVSDVLDALDNARLAAPRTDKIVCPPVWLGDVMRFRGRSFDEVFAVRMQDDILPQRRIEDPLLPDSDRRTLGIREIGNGRDEEQLLFQLLCDGASDAIHFSYAASDGFGKPLRPSQLLKNFVIAQKPDAKQAVLKNFSRYVNGARVSSPAPPAREDTRAPKRALQLFQLAGTRGPFDGFITSERVLARAAASLQHVSPTHLEDFGECPQKFLLKHILRVRDIDDPEREVQINHRDKGTLDHRILERFYKTLTQADVAAISIELPRIPDTIRERLEHIVEEEFDAFEADVPAYNRQMRAIERRATRRLLGAFVSDDLTDTIAKGLMPRHFEYRFGAKWQERGFTADHPEPFTVEARGVLLRVEGMIDRIDTDGRAFRIIDYKSGKALRHQNLEEKVDAGVRLQLAVYSMAVAEFFGATDISAAIRPLVSGEADLDKYTFNLADKRDRLRETLEIFVSAILRGAFPAFPNQSDSGFNSCKYCPVNHSCRTKHDAVESRTVLRHENPRSLLEMPR